MRAAATYTISGTQFNGLTAGAAYGDDLQSSTSYPLVRITNKSTHNVFYAKTHNHSTMAVATGNAIVSTRSTSQQASTSAQATSKSWRTDSHPQKRS